MKILHHKQFDPSYWALIFCLIAVVYVNIQYKVWKSPDRVIISDVRLYYAYLPATFILNDIKLDFINRGENKLGEKLWVKKSPTGNFSIIYSCGMAILYLPFFAGAHFSAELLGFPADGFSVPYKFALVLSSIFFMMLGAVFLRKFLLKYFPPLEVGLTLIIIILTTNLLYYTSLEAPMTHAYSFGLIAIFLYKIDTWIEHPTTKISIIIGLLIGIISLIRPTNIVIVLLFALWKITTWKGLAERIVFFLKKWNSLILMLTLAILVWLPQFIYWKYVTGSYFYYSYPNDQGFYFLNPQLFSTLFSWRKGLFIYTPVLIFAFIGIGLLYKNKKYFFWPVLIYFLVTWYIISSWWSWWYGGSFGLRPFIDSYAIFSIGLAAFLNWLLKTKWIPRLLFGSLIVLLASLSVWNFMKYYGGSIHWVGMTKEAYFDSFWQKNPSAEFSKKIRLPDNNLAKKGIYKYADEANKSQDN